MRRTVRAFAVGVPLAVFGAIGLAALAPAATAEARQVVLDRTLSKVNGHIITETDVREAKTLKLVDDTSSDAAVQRALENRVLILQEIDHAAPVPAPTADELAARRREWGASVGGDERARTLLGDATMSEKGVEDWLRDDLRIRAYLARQFGGIPDADRAKVIADWLTRLRQRAGLP